MTKKRMSRARIKFRLDRAKNLIALRRFEEEQSQLLFYWIAVNNAIQGLKKKGKGKK